jgi:SAM-dependent methyltransferase
MKNYLIILAGSPRGGKKTWNSLFKYVINPLQADLAILTTDNFLSNSILFQKAKYKWIVKNPKDFKDYYKENYSGRWKEYFLKGKNTGLLESGLIHFTFKDIVLKQYLDIVESYDFIIYSRFDQYYVDYHPELNKNINQIVIPEGEDYFGICDRHAAFNAELASEFFSICEFIDSEDTDKYTNKILNSETAYMNQLQNCKLEPYIVRSSRLQFTSAISTDKTNWRIPKYKILFSNGLFIKYPDEFLDSIKNLIHKYSFFVCFFKHPTFITYYCYLQIRKFVGIVLKNTLKKLK